MRRATPLARELPGWSATGIDLSAPSLAIARQLAEKYELSNTHWLQRSYLDDLSDLGKFDVIGCHGTIHHSADPAGALNSLVRVLNHGGMMYVHLYGWRLDRGKFDIKRLLDIFVPDINDIEGRWKIYQALMEHRRKRWLQGLVKMRLIDFYTGIRNGIHNLFRSSKGITWSPSWQVNYTEPTAPWIDHFCHPCERAYSVPDVIELFAKTDLEIVSMTKQGREHPRFIPDGWQPLYEELPAGKKWEISELLADGGASFAIVAMRKGD